jgi:hypothetical protein
MAHPSLACRCGVCATARSRAAVREPCRSNGSAASTARARSTVSRGSRRRGRRFLRAMRLMNRPRRDMRRCICQLDAMRSGLVRPGSAKVGRWNRAVRPAPEQLTPNSVKESQVVKGLRRLAPRREQACGCGDVDFRDEQSLLTVRLIAEQRPVGTYHR